MFGFQGGETAGTVERKKVYMKEAQKIWPFLTNFDLSTIKNAMQLATMIKVRSGISIENAQRDVQIWMQDKKF